MRYTVEGFSQAKMVELGMDTKDAIMLRWFIDFQNSGAMKEHHVDGETYYWINYQYVIDSLPILGIKNPEVIGRHFQKMVKAGVLQRIAQKIYRGTNQYFRPGPRYIELVDSNRADAKVESNGHRVDAKVESTPHSKVESTPHSKVVSDSSSKDSSSKDAQTFRARVARLKSREGLTQWETSFLANCALQLDQERGLTAKQVERLESIEQQFSDSDHQDYEHQVECPVCGTYHDGENECPYCECPYTRKRDAMEWAKDKQSGLMDLTGVSFSFQMEMIRIGKWVHPKDLDESPAEKELVEA